MHRNPLLVVLGPTASGKTKLAVRLAAELNGEIISADSRQVFRGMDIGTGKDINEYFIDGKQITYHLINNKLAGERYNVNEFKEDFYTAFKQVSDSGKLPVLCGGTGMYIHSVLQNYEYTAVPVNGPLRAHLIKLSIEELKNELLKYPSETTSHADTSSHKRMIRAIEIADYLLDHDLPEREMPFFEPIVIGLFSDVAVRRVKIIDRLEKRLEEGMIDEVKRLINDGVTKEDLTFYGLEYKFIAAYLDNELSYSDLKEKLSIAIRQFAKRQMTFFRKMEKDGVKITWFNTELNSDDIFQKAVALYYQQFGVK